MLKRVLIFSVTVCLMCFASCDNSNNNENIMQSTISFEHSNSVLDIAAGKDGQVYTADKEFINIYDADGKILRKNKYESCITNLATNGNEIFAFDIITGMIIKTNKEGVQLHKLKLKTRFSEILKIRCLSNVIFILGYEEGNYSKVQFIKIDLTSGEEGNIDIDKICSFTAYEKDAILVLTNQSLIEYNYVKNTIEKSFDKHFNTSELEYDTVNKKLYYIKDGMIFSANMTDIGDEELIGEQFISKLEGNLRSFCKMAISNKFIYVLCNQGGIVIRILKQNNIESNSLIFLTPNNDKDFDEAFENSENIPVIRKSGLVSNREKFVISLMAGDTEFDIFELRTYLPQSYSIVKNKIFVDLRSSSLLENNVQQMFKPIKESAYFENQIFGLPISAHFEGLFYNTSVISQNDLDSIVTWNDLVEFSETNNSNGAVSLNKYRMQQLILEQYFLNYNNMYNGKIDYSTEKFKNALLTMKTLNNSPNIHHASVFSDSIGANYKIIIAATGYKESFIVNFKELPRLDKDNNQVSGLSIGWVLINPNSKKKDKAIKYLEAIATKQINQHNITTSSKMLYDNEKYYSNVNSEWFNHYKKTIDKYRVYFEFDIYNNIKSILESFFSDKISVDKAVNEINNKIKIMISE